MRSLEDELKSIIPAGVNLIVTGSFGRLEGHSLSDLDYFLLHDDTVLVSKLKAVSDEVKNTVRLAIGIEPGPDGPWGAYTSVVDIDKQIGGNTESNFSFTRRILFLFERRAVGNDALFQCAKNSLLDRYIKPTISDHQIGLFLLNDTIRFYRTMCVDFEHKTVEQGKSWGLNVIKLVFSRKLLYFSGLLVAAEMYQRSFKEKRSRTIELLELSPIERIQSVCGLSADKALQIYDTFLERLGDPSFREIATNTCEKKPHNDEFSRLKNASHHFSMALSQTLHGTYDASHPIHRHILM